MSAKKRTYKFNWLDHLYYIGKGCDKLPYEWTLLTPFHVVMFSILMWPLMFCIIFWAKSDEQKIICMTFWIAAILFYQWPLEKYRFTPEREQAYFRLYPQRRQLSLKVMPWLPIKILLGNIAIWWFLIYLLR